MYIYGVRGQGQIQGGAIGAISPLKPTKATFFTMIFNNSENRIRDIGQFAVHCFVTAVL